MINYHVSWEIEIEANSPHEAAQKALEIQRSSESIATVFKMRDETGETTEVDLDDDSSCM